MRETANTTRPVIDGDLVDLRYDRHANGDIDAKEELVDMRLDLVGDAEMAEYRLAMTTDAGRRAAWLDALVADLMAEDASERMIERLQAEAKREYERAKRSIRPRGDLGGFARGQIRPRQRCRRPSAAVRSPRRSHRASPRHVGSDDPGGEPPADSRSDFLTLRRSAWPASGRSAWPASGRSAWRSHHRSDSPAHDRQVIDHGETDRGR